MRYLLLFSLLLFSFAQGKTFEVSGGGDELQQAVDQATAGDSIIIMDSKEYGQTTLDGKRGLVLVSQTYLDNVVNGDYRFAPDMPKIKHQDTEHTHPHDDEESFKPEYVADYSTNGALRILECSDVVVEGVDVDGDGNWQRYYRVWGGTQLFGNNAIALFNSGKVQIRGCKIHNAHRGIHHKDRNLAGIFTSANPDDIDVEDFSPAGNPLTMGNHIIEQNMIYDNHWGIFLEILWDAASTYRNNLIFKNMLQDEDYVIHNRGAALDTTNSKVNYVYHVGGAVKVHGARKVPLEFRNNTFYKNLDQFNSHWAGGQADEKVDLSGGPNFVFVNNYFGKSDDRYQDNDDIFGNSEYKDASEEATIKYYKKYSVFNSKYIGLPTFNRNTIAKQWFSGKHDEIGYVPYAKFDGDLTPDGGESLDSYSYLNRDAQGRDNIYENGDVFKDTDDKGSSDFFVPNDKSAMVDRGYSSFGEYDVDLSKADVGAIDINGEWAGTGSPLTLYDRDRYAVVDFYDNSDGDATSSVDIRFRLEYSGAKIDKIEYSVERYYADIQDQGTELPEEFGIEMVNSTLTDDDVKNQLNNGDIVEVRYYGNSANFNKNSESKFARFKLQVKITDNNGDVFYSNVGIFDYQKVPVEFKIALSTYEDDGSHGSGWDYGHTIPVYEPFWMNIKTIKDDGEAFDMSVYNDQDVIVLNPDILKGYLWKWNSSDIVDPSAKPGVDERWTLMNDDDNSNYLNSGWGADGTLEGVFAFSKPSGGDEYLRANLKGAGALDGSLSGTSKGFKVVSIPDSIVYFDTPYLSYDDAQNARINAGTLTQTTVKLVVLDVDLYSLIGQKVQLTIDPSIGSFVDYSDSTLVNTMTVWVTTEGYAKFDFVATDVKGALAFINATASGNPDKVVTKNLEVGLVYNDVSKPKVVPNVGYRMNMKYQMNIDEISSSNITAINKELGTQHNDPSSTKFIVLDFKIPAMDYPEGSKFNLRAVVSTIQGNIVKEIIPNATGNANAVYTIMDPDLTGEAIQLEKSDDAKFVGVGQVESQVGLGEFRVATVWNHVNDKGRLAESGVFVILLYVEDQDGNTTFKTKNEKGETVEMDFPIKTYYIVK